MENAPKASRFLEPVFLNESMALNCAAYLFGGYILESDATLTNEKRREGSVRVGLDFLNNMIGIKGSTASLTVDEQRAARRFTIGGLHMNVLDALYKEKMIKTVTSSNLDSSGLGDTYVDVHAVLKPSEYQSLLGVLKTLGPLLAQTARDYGRTLAEYSELPTERWDDIEPEIAKYKESILAIVNKLEEDYLTSKQLDMVMWSCNNKPLGVVDLDVSDYDAAQLRAKLSGGHYHVIGKVVARAGRGEAISLMQKTMLLEVAELVKRFVAAASPSEVRGQRVPDPEAEREGQDASANFKSQVASVLRTINKVVSLEVPGPAIRVTAMSVCL